MLLLVRRHLLWTYLHGGQVSLAFLGHRESWYAEAIVSSVMGWPNSNSEFEFLEVVVLKLNFVRKF